MRIPLSLVAAPLLMASPVGDAEARSNRITWTGNRITAASPQLRATAAPHLSGDKILASVSIDPTAPPRQMDIVYVGGPAAPALAIYEWMGDN